MPPKLNPEQVAALEWKTENSEYSEPSAPTHHRSPVPSNSARGRSTHRVSTRQHSNPSPRPVSNSRAQAPQPSTSNNPFSLLDAAHDADSPERSESDSAAPAIASPTPQRHLFSDNLIDLGDNGNSHMSAAAFDPNDEANYQGLDALEDLSTFSQFSSRATTPQTPTPFNPPPRGPSSPRGRGAWGNRGQAGRGQSSHSQTSHSQSFRGQFSRGQSFRGQSNRGHYIHGGGGRANYYAASSSRGTYSSGHNHHSNAGPPSRTPSWPGSPRGPRGSSVVPGRGASSRAPSSPASLRSSRGSTRQTTSSPYSGFMRVNRRMARFLSEHKDKHGSYPPRLQEIATMTNTNIKNPVCHRVPEIDGEYNVMSLEICGSSGDAVQQFKQMFEEWSKRVLDEVNPQWADAPGGYIPHVEKARAKAIRNKEKKERFRQPRPDGLPDPKWTVEVEWKSKVPPTKILGLKYEVLDSIRMQHSCWMTRKKDEDRAIFTVEGDDREHVDAAVERFQNIDRQGEANRFNAEAVNILDIAGGVHNWPDVLLSEYFGFPDTRSLGKKPEFISSTSPVSFTENTGTVAMEALVESITPMTERARFYRSLLGFRVYLGTFVMTTYPADVQTLDFDEFSDAMEENRMRAFVTEEIGDQTMESTLFQRICKATHLHQVSDVAYLMQRPIYSATFKFNNPDKGRLMLHVELSQEEGSTTVQQKRWYRTEHGQEDLRKILDVNMVNLSQGLAWHLEMTSAETVDESSLSEDYQKFPDSLSVDTKSHNFLVYGPHGGRSLKVPLKSVYQKRLWRLETKFGYWSVEVAAGQETTFSGRDMSCGKPKWSLNVVNGKHELTFSSNAVAGHGQLADWGSGDPVEELFPFDWEPSLFSEEPPQKKMTTSFKEHVEGKGKGRGRGKADPDHGPDDGEESPDLRGLKQLLRLLHGLHDVVVGGSTSS